MVIEKVEVNPFLLRLYTAKSVLKLLDSIPLSDEKKKELDFMDIEQMGTRNIGQTVIQAVAIDTLKKLLKLADDELIFASCAKH